MVSLDSTLCWVIEISRNDRIERALTFPRTERSESTTTLAGLRLRLVYGIGKENDNELEGGRVYNISRNKAQDFQFLLSQKGLTYPGRPRLRQGQSRHKGSHKPWHS